VGLRALVWSCNFCLSALSEAFLAPAFRFLAKSSDASPGLDTAKNSYVPDVSNTSNVPAVTVNPGWISRHIH